MSTKTKVVFNDVEEVKVWELENYLATLRNSLMCPKWAKTCKVDTSGFEPARVTYSQALAFVREALVVGLDSCPLREVLDRAASIGTVKLAMGGATVHTPKEVIELKSVAGYFVPEKRQVEVLDNWVADAVAFQQTPLSAKEVGVIDSAVTPAIEKALNLEQQSFTVGVPKQWTTDAVENSDALIDMFKRPKLAYHSAKYASEMSAHWAHHGQRVVVKSDPRLDPFIYQSNDGKRVISIPNAVTQPNLVPVEEVSFYKTLHAHRLARGADGAGRSRLTSGYYIGSMSRALDQQLWQSIDLLAMCRFFSREEIYLLDRPNYNVVNTLIANRIDVNVYSQKSFGKTKFTVFRKAPPNYNNGLVYVDGFFGVGQPIVDKKGKISGKLESEFDAEFEAFKQIDGFAFTHVYLRNFLGKYMDYILPSVHVHAGHAIICNRMVHKETYTLKSLFARASMANKYKTSFAVRRVPFITQDRFRPKFLVKEGIVLGLSVEDDNSEYVEDPEFTHTYEDAYQAPPMMFASKNIVPVETAAITIIPLPDVIKKFVYDADKEVKVEDDHDVDEFADDDEYGDNDIAASSEPIIMENVDF